MFQLYLALLKVPFQLLSAAAVLGGVFLMYEGFKGEPMDAGMGLRGLFLMVFGIFCFPSRHHILYRLWQKRRFRLETRPAGQAGAEPRLDRRDAAQPGAATGTDSARSGSGPQAQSWTRPTLYGDRVRLDLILPPPDATRATSWIGGLPKLPRAVGWPTTPDGPMLFVAQIAVADLPHGIWGGLGPRTGSLAFFVHAADDHRKVRVLHLEGLTEERAYPGPLEVIQAYPILKRGLKGELLSGPPDDDAPPLMKWPVRPTPIDPEDDLPHPAGKHRDPNCIGVTHRQGVSLSDPAFVPYDWDTLIALVTSLIVRMNGSIRREGTRTDMAEALKQSQAERKAVAAILTDVRTDLRKRRRRGETFSPQDWSRTRARIEGLSVRWARKVENAGEGTPGHVLQDPEPLLNSLPRLEYYSAFEYLSRRIYARDPGALPEAVRASFEPVWEHDASFEVALMGGRADIAAHTAGVHEDMVCLLEVPFSEMVGMVWHDMSSFGFFIDPESLMQGRLDRAIGSLAE